MGKLRKTKIDSIIRLRKQGYTQAETAERVGVHVKTVQRHDPLRRSKNQTGLKTAEGSTIEDLEHHIKCLGDWVDSLAMTLRSDLRVELLCPSCLEGTLTSDDETGERFFCNDCGYEMPLPSYVWEKD